MKPGDIWHFGGSHMTSIVLTVVNHEIVWFAVEFGMGDFEITDRTIKHLTKDEWQMWHPAKECPDGK